MSRPEHGNTSS
jgi:hypothetical protein